MWRTNGMTHPDPVAGPPVDNTGVLIGITIVVASIFVGIFAIGEYYKIPTIPSNRQ